MRSSFSSTTRGRGHVKAGHSWRGRSGRGDGPSQQYSTDNRVADSSLKPRLTHFLAMPIGHHPNLRAEMSAFSSSLLSTDPPIPGMDKSIIIPSRRLHFTLGVMALRSSSSSSSSDAANSERPTLEAAIDFLHSLKPKIDEMLVASNASSSKLSVALNTMDVLKSEKNDMAHVVWIGPGEGNFSIITDTETKRLRDVCDFVHNSFKTAGFVTEERPLKLHCTIINTTHRKPKPRGGKRLAFSYKDIVEAPWFLENILKTSDSSSAASSTAIPGSSSSILGQPSASNVPESSRGPRRTLRNVRFGTYDIDEVQICEMGSWGPEGEYVSVGSIPVK